MFEDVVILLNYIDLILSDLALRQYVNLFEANPLYHINQVLYLILKCVVFPLTVVFSSWYLKRKGERYYKYYEWCLVVISIIYLIAIANSVYHITRANLSMFFK